ncbi:rhodanese-like domain-containing protein [Breoghania sp.]|uniref:sulfurtransferase n=1 Tax=Breoghania sp. TaxID=2065378 RepID=UPI00261D133E|nr:rhodanese-like domain-containing protein [Breoghania sp.]MDJ0932973.1 rhodanese-like domain-containing protein [Breoghania sp.]
MTDKSLLSPEELAELMEREPCVIIDTRDPESYAAGHIPGVVDMHDIFTYPATSSSDGIAELRHKFAEEFGAAGLSGEETAVIYEQSMATGFCQSCRGYFLLQYLGYPKVKVLHGGFATWDAAGLPVSTDAVTPTPKTFPVSEVGADLMLDVADMMDAIKTDDIVKLDVRDIDEWIAENSSPYGKDFCPRKGRVPGAKRIEWYRMMKPTATGPMIKTKPEILAECATVGITPETPVYLYYFKGARASNTYLALKEAGVKDVKIYFGSWNEWSRDPELPIEEGLPY